jgi:uncharacterized membrane protein (DUF485 family)
MNEYEHEPVRGLPEKLPPGESIVWQGEPLWRVMATRVFHTRTLGVYFSLLILLHFGSRLLAGATLGSALVSASWQLGLAGATMAILSLMAYLYARSTVYTLTDRRLVMRFGVAVPMMVNIPLDTVESAALREFGDGSGDIALTPMPGTRMSYWTLWPNARPWHFGRVKPMLRCVPRAQTVAARLAGLVAADGAETTPKLTSVQPVRPDRGMVHADSRAAVAS